MGDSNWVEVVAASATAISAIVIAWQAWQTRAAVKASQETVEASRAAVDVAQAALRESQLARLESGVPRLFVTTPTSVDASKVTEWVTSDDSPTGHTWASVAKDDIFKLPRDKDRRLLISHEVTVGNDGPGSIDLQTSGFVRFKDQTTGNIIRAGVSRLGTFAIIHSVEDWVALANQQARGEEAVAHKLTISFSGPKDADIEELHELEVTGSCLVPVPDANGDWVIEGDVFDSNMEASVQPAQRRYWRSRSKKLEF